MNHVNINLGLGEPFGVRVIESLVMTESVEDWSRVRSPSRAMRRLRRGHRQNVRIVQEARRDAIMADGGRTMVIHPVLAAQIRNQLSERVDRIAREVMMGGSTLPPASDISAQSIKKAMLAFNPTRNVWRSPFFSEVTS